MTDFPMGDGHPECPKCKGRGVIDYTPPGRVIPGALICSCVRLRDYRLNMDKAWRGLSRYKPVDETPLIELIGSNLWLTAREGVLRRHLVKVAFSQPSMWNFQVQSDADLMDAWLSKVSTKDILDPDVEQIRGSSVSGRYAALTDLVTPPELLLIRVGVKAARNVAMPEVLLEALQYRSMQDKPTWVVDTPSYTLQEGHIAFNHRVGEYLEDWPYLSLEEEGEVSSEIVGETEKKSPGRMTYSSIVGGGSR